MVMPRGSRDLELVKWAITPAVVMRPIELSGVGEPQGAVGSGGDPPGPLMLLLVKMDTSPVGEIRPMELLA